VNLVDGAIVLVMVAGFVHGAIKGAIQEVTGVVALIVGVVVAGKVATGTLSVTGTLSHPTAGKIFAFVVAFIIVAVAIGLLGMVISNMVKKSTLSPIDRILGGVIGACLVGIAVGLVFKLMVMGGFGGDAIPASPLAQKLMNAVSYLTRFLPQGSDEGARSATYISTAIGRVFGGA